MTPPADHPPPGFPFATAAAALVGVGLFAGLVLVAYESPAFFGGPADPTPDPALKLAEVRAKNRAVADGTDPAAKMAIGPATARVLALTEKGKDAAHPSGRLPFPVEPAAPLDPKDKK